MLSKGCRRRPGLQGANLRERRSFALTAAIPHRPFFRRTGEVIPWDCHASFFLRCCLTSRSPGRIPHRSRLASLPSRRRRGDASRRQAVRRVERRLLYQSFRFARLRVAASLDDLRGLKARTIRTMDEVARTWWMIRSGLRDPVFCQAGVGREGAMVLTLSARRRIMPPKIMRWIG